MFFQNFFDFSIGRLRGLALLINKIGFVNYQEI